MGPYSYPDITDLQGNPGKITKTKITKTFYPKKRTITKISEFKLWLFRFLYKFKDILTSEDYEKFLNMYLIPEFSNSILKNMIKFAKKIYNRVCSLNYGTVLQDIWEKLARNLSLRKLLSNCENSCIIMTDLSKFREYRCRIFFSKAIKGINV